MRNLHKKPDFWAILTMLILWVLFFWRVMTPVEADQLSFAEGDFSGQFVAWADYAVERLDAGELPLWNPYQYGGAPFQASPQTRLTYPPHMLTLASLLIQGDVTRAEVYTALQWEVMLHVLLASLFVYVFTRAMIAENRETTREQAVFGGLAAGLTYAYGGYAAGFPILQTPLLEAGIWLPLVWLGVLKATAPGRTRMGWGWIIFSGWMMGVSLLAGHPQTSLFIIYMAVAFLIFRTWRRGWRWHQAVMAIVLAGLVSFGISAVQLLPTAEFTALTTRADLGFEAKGGGFSFEEISNILFPIRGKIWNASHLGIVPLILAGVAVWQRVRAWRFFSGLMLVAILLSFGARTPLFGALYLVLPGLRLFRGQERAMFVVAHCFAVLVGLGAAHLMTWGSWRDETHRRKLTRALVGLLAVSVIYALVMYFLAQTEARSETIIGRMDGGALTAIMLGLMLLALPWYLSGPGQRSRQIALIALLAFDLFSVTAMLRQNYEPVPVSERLVTPAYLQTMTDPLQVGARVDGSASIPWGYSTLYRLPDIGGSDPLQLESTKFYVEDLAPARRWELLAVAVVNSLSDGIAGQGNIIASDMLPQGDLLIWQLDDPRPFAHPVYQVTTVNNDAEARGLVREPAFDLRNVAIIEGDPGPLAPDANPEGEASVTITRFDPEHIDITARVPRPTILTLALPQMPGWSAQVNGEDAKVLRAYGGLCAVYLSGDGEFFVNFRYESPWLMIGGVISVLSWLGISLSGFITISKSRRRT